VVDRLVWTLVRETLNQLFDRAAKHPWRKLPEKQPISQFVCEPCDPDEVSKPHVCPAGQLGRMIYKSVEQRKAKGTYCVWPHPAEPPRQVQLMSAAECAEEHGKLPLELRMRALGLYENFRPDRWQ
jgi:hypothetical protein